MRGMRTGWLALLLIAGCAERWERPGATEAESDAAQAQCGALATRQVPPAMVWTQVTAATWAPAERRCRTRSDGTQDCVYSPARYIPPRFDWVDVNTQPRRAARNACLVEGGWTYGGLRPLRLN